MSALAGRVALVTGATGFVGGALVRRLVADGAIVHAASRRRRPDGHGVRWWEGDLSDPDAGQRVMESVRPDVVFHLAGEVSGSRDVARVLPMLRANLLSCLGLLVAAAERGGPRIVFAGSLEEGQPEGIWPVPASPYAASKLAAGLYARMFHALYGTAVVWLRIFMVYGPAQPDATKLVPFVTLSLLRGEAPSVSTGRRQVDWVYVDDVVEALVRGATVQGIEGRSADVGSGRLVSVRSVVEELARVVGSGVSPRFGAVPDRPLEVERSADVATAEAVLGWRARMPLEEGLRQTVEWYRSHAPDLGASEEVAR